MSFILAEILQYSSLLAVYLSPTQLQLTAMAMRRSVSTEGHSFSPEGVLNWSNFLQTWKIFIKILDICNKITKGPITWSGLARWTGLARLAGMRFKNLLHGKGSRLTGMSFTKRLCGWFHNGWLGKICSAENFAARFESIVNKTKWWVRHLTRQTLTTVN